MSDLVYVYDTATGERRPHPVPRRWLTHPTLGRGISETPPAAVAEETTTTVYTDAPAAGENPEED